MSAKKLTIDDVRHHAEDVQDLAKAEVRDFFDEKGTQAAIIGIVAVVAAVSIAFYLGSRLACDYSE